MVKSDFPVKGVLEIIEAAHNTMSNSIICRKILNFCVKNFNGEGSIFFISDGNSKFKELVKKNIDEEYNKAYKDYYCKFDPLQLLQKNKDEEVSAVLARTVDYSKVQKGEYYNDFLLPQAMHYKLLFYLRTDDGLLAKILLTKSKKTGNFSKQKVQLAKEIAPYLAHALEYNNLKKEITEKNGLFGMIEDNLTTGIILLDPSKKIIHINSKAGELCNIIKGEALANGNVSDLHPIIVKDSLDMIDEYNNSSNKLILPRKRIFFSNSRVFSICSKFITDRDNSKYFLVSINENIEPSKCKNEEIKNEFHLSKRELDVANQVLKGLHNSEIAKNLFISEITVKKHLQNIFEKMEVNNRTSLVQKILSE